MSESETAVDDAIRTVIAEQNDGAIVIGWVLVAAAIAPDGVDATHYTYVAAEGQSVHVSLGLHEMGRQYHLRTIGNAADE